MTKPNAYCPSCGQPAIRDGNRVTCPGCDKTFKIDAVGAARPVNGNPIKDLQDRLAKVESKLLADPDADPDADPPADPNADLNDESEDDEW